MRKLSSIIALSLAIWVMPLIAQGTTLGLQTTSSEESEGKVLVPIHIETDLSEPVASLQFDLHFDPKALRFSDVLAADAAQDAEKSAHSNLLRPGVVRVIIAGLNRTTMDTGLLAQIQFSAVNPLLTATTVTMEGAILSDPYGSSVPVTLSPNTVVLEQNAGILQASLATGTASPKPPGNPYGTYYALVVALLCVVAAMTWSRKSTVKGGKR
ncbi:MAG: cohesin domain-containing protein [Candidatus Hydrogenedentes bacterium]|nr:cohesin domain-containing protein [Candidatus Hydrogenedentota bacterium]